MIDLHAHTNKSDGSLSPLSLVRAAAAMKLKALAITDHDTLAGFDEAIQPSSELGLELVCGVEISTAFRGRSIHLLAYFLECLPDDNFRAWLQQLQVSRHERNRLLVAKLQAQGIRISLEELRKRGGSLPGRAHVAAILVKKGYVETLQQAFDRYLAESGACFVSRQEPSLEEALRRVLAAGGLPSLAHPGRLHLDDEILEQYLSEMRALGLKAVEAFHSSHDEEVVSTCQSLANRLSLAVTGGSDFHGESKPDVALGSGIRGNVNVPLSLLENLRRLAKQP
jgi:predicted metal-dependent phosphoesterase TrpH